MPPRTDARRRVTVAMRKALLAETVARRLLLTRPDDNQYVRHLFNRAKRFRDLANAISENEIEEPTIAFLKRERRLQNEVNKLIKSMTGVYTP